VRRRELLLQVGQLLLEGLLLPLPWALTLLVLCSELLELLNCGR